MLSTKLTIELPYEGTLAKDLVRAAVNLMLLSPHNMTIRQYGSVLEIEGPLSAILTTTETVARRLIEIKDNANVRWPDLHQNDRGTLKRSYFIATRIENMETYGDLAKEYIKLLPELSKVGTVKFAEGNVSMLQLFKVEFYETALSYNKPYRHEIEIRTNDYMLSLLLTGLAAAYVGFIEILVPSTIEDRCVANTYSGLTTSMAYEKDIRIRTNPIIPYIFYVHVILNRIKKEVGETCLETSSFTLHRILAGRTFTEISREEIKINSEILDFIDSLNNECLSGLMRLAQLASGAISATALNALTFLYEAINGAIDPGFALYYLARIITDLNNTGRRISISKECFRSIIDVLEKEL